jgi:hypothetical protein
VGAAPQYTLLVLEAALPLAPSLLPIAAQPLGHRARSSLCRPAYSGSWLPSESTQRPGVPEVRKGVAHRRVDHRDGGVGPGGTADARGAVPDVLEAIVTVGPDHQCHRRAKLVRRIVDGGGTSWSMLGPALTGLVICDARCSTPRAGWARELRANPRVLHTIGPLGLPRLSRGLLPVAIEEPAEARLTPL